jgi:hypothetical protein
MRAGAVAEMAVARRLHLYPMLQFKEYHHWNLRLASGELVNVQWDAKRRAATLSHDREADRKKKGKEAPDLYIVLTGDFTDTGRSRFEFVGWTTHDELLAAKVEDVRYGPHWICRELHPVLEILTSPRGAGYRRGQERDAFDFRGTGTLE